MSSTAIRSNTFTMMIIGKDDFFALGRAPVSGSLGAAGAAGSFGAGGAVIFGGARAGISRSRRPPEGCGDPPAAG